MRRRFFKCISYMCVLIVLGVLLSLFHVVVLPGVVRHIIVSKLAEIGLPESALEVRSCSWRSAELVNVSLGEEGSAYIGAMSVQYSLRSLSRARFKKIRVVGGQLVLRLRDGRIELMDTVQLKGGAGEPPFDLIELYACELSIEGAQERIAIPCAGSVVNQGDGRLAGDLNLGLPGLPVPVRVASIYEAGALFFTAEKEGVDVRALLAALPDGMLDLPARLAGRMDFKLEGSIAGSGGPKSCALTVRDGWLKTRLANRSVDADGVALRFYTEWKDQSRPEKVELKLTVAALQYGAFGVDGINCTLQKSAEGYALQGSAEGDGWRLKKLAGIVPEPYAKDGARQAKIAWELEGHAPQFMVSRMRDRGWDLSKIGAMNLSGVLSAPVPVMGAGARPEFEVPELKVVLAPGELRMMKQGIALHELAGVINLAGNCENGRCNFHSLPGSFLEFGSADIGAVNIDKTRVALQGAETRSEIECNFVEEGGLSRVHLAAFCDRTAVQAGEQGGRMTVDDARLVADARLNAAAATATARATLGRVSCSLGAAGLTAELKGAELKADLGPGGDAGPVLDATLAVETASLINRQAEELLVINKEVLRPIAATYNLTQREGRVQWKWPLQPLAVLNANGYLDLRGSRPAGVLSFDCEGFRIMEEQALIGTLADSAGLTLSGAVSLRGNLRLDRGSLVPRITLATTGAKVVNNRYRVQAEGIDGSITITGFSPWSTPGNQRIEIEHLKLGKLNMHDGVVVFCLEDDPQAILVERAEWGFLGGRVYSRALRLDPAHPDIDLRLFVDGLDIGQLFGLAFGSGGSGSGSLYGMIPATISRTNLVDFTVGEGFLYSTSGEGSWKLGGNDAAGMVQQVLERQLERLLPDSVDEGVHDRILSALRDFEYDLFKVDLIRQKEGILARITARGQSRNQGVPVAFEEIVLDLPGFDKNLKQAMIIKTALDPGVPPASD